jgi:hypothetical protein
MSHACSYQEMIPPQVPLPLRVGVGLLARCGTALPPPPAAAAARAVWPLWPVRGFAHPEQVV